MASRAIVEELVKFLQGFRSMTVFSIGQNIQNHINDFEKYSTELNINADDDKCKKLIESLEENARCELQSIPNFKTNERNFDWIKGKLIELYQTKATKVSHLINILNLKQDDMTIREYLTAVRVAGIKEMLNHDEHER